MSKPKPPAPAHSDGEQARRLLELLSGGGPDAARQRREHAESHGESVRRRRARRPIAPDGAAAAAAQRLAEPAVVAPERRKEAPRRRASRPRKEPAPRVYVHQTPTRSAVLNAFLHAFNGCGLVEPTAAVPDEHLLAPRLVAFARRYWPRVIRARGKGDLAREIEEMLLSADDAGARDGAARFLMRQAAQVPGELASIACDYLVHHERAGEPELDDWVAHCITATFAGRQLRDIQEVLGHHVRDDVRRELRRLISEVPPRVRRDVVREAVLPGAAKEKGRAKKTSQR